MSVAAERERLKIAEDEARAAEVTREHELAKVRGERLRLMVEDLIATLDIYGHLKGDRRAAKVLIGSKLCDHVFVDKAVDIPSF